MLLHLHSGCQLNAGSGPGPGAGVEVYLFFKECCFRVRTRVRVDTNPNPSPNLALTLTRTLTLTFKTAFFKKKIDPGPDPNPDTAFYSHPFIHNILKFCRHLGTDVQNIAIAINFVISHVKLIFYPYPLGDSKTSLIFVII